MQVQERQVNEFRNQENTESSYTELEQEYIRQKQYTTNQSKDQNFGTTMDNTIENKQPHEINYPKNTTQPQNIRETKKGEYYQ